MKDERPNVLVIHCHDLGRFVGSYGYPHVATPHIDRLAAEGVRFDEAFAVAPQCSPSRASLFTGQYPQRNGVLGLTHADFGWDLFPDVRHIGQRLAAAGYRTGLIGVHHESRRLPDADVADRLAMSYVATGGTADIVADRTIAVIAAAADRDEPFYLQVGFHEPHRRSSRETQELGYTGFLHEGFEPDTSRGITKFPYLHDDPAGRDEIAELQGAVRYMDAGVGRILDALDEYGLGDDTIVVFTTDHGLALPRAKCSLYDPGLEIALVMRWRSGGWEGGRVVDDLVSNIDVVPTIVDAVGIALDAAVDGASLRALLDGRSDESRGAVFGQLTYHDYYDPRRSVRTDRYKLIVNFSSAPPYMSPTQSWRPRTRAKVPAENASHAPVELYDLVEDPYELANLSDRPELTDVVDDLLGRLAAWMKAVDDPLLHGPVSNPMHERAVVALRRRTAREMAG